MSASIFDTIDPRMLERIRALRLIDDDFMTAVFGGNNELTEFLLKILLSRDDIRVKSCMTQKEIRNLFGRSVRLDIVAEDAEGKMFNVEIQRADKGASAKRVRYNLFMLDSRTLKKHDKFADLPATYIIFITENDIFGQDKAFYKVQKHLDCTDDNGNFLPFDDGCTIIYVNGSYRANDAIGKLMHDFFEADASKMFYSEIAENVRFHKQDTKGVNTMCRIFEEYGNERAAIAKEEGRAEARAETRNEVAEDLLRRTQLPLEEVSAISRLPIERVKELAEKLSVPAMA